MFSFSSSTSLLFILVSRVQILNIHKYFLSSSIHSYIKIVITKLVCVLFLVPVIATTVIHYQWHFQSTTSRNIFLLSWWKSIQICGIVAGHITNVPMPKRKTCGKQSEGLLMWMRHVFKGHLPRCVRSSGGNWVMKSCSATVSSPSGNSTMKCAF